MNDKIPKEFQNSFILGLKVILRHPVTFKNVLTWRD